MSNYIFLIIDTYNEKEKNNSNIKSRIKLADFAKENKLSVFVFFCL